MAPTEPIIESNRHRKSIFKYVIESILSLLFYQMKIQLSFIIALEFWFISYHN